MRFAISILASLLAIAPLDARTEQHEPRLARIRPMQKDGARLLADGIAQSATFRRLVEHLEHSNVIVYVELRPDMPINRGGTLRFLARSTTDTFLRIHLNRVFTGRTLIALLGASQARCGLPGRAFADTAEVRHGMAPAFLHWRYTRATATATSPVATAARARKSTVWN